MRLKDIEKRIISSLEDSAPLSPEILQAAKQEMSKEKRRFTSKFALACVSIVVCLAIILPIIIFQVLPKKYQTTDYSSMQDYIDFADIPIKTFNQVTSDNGLASESETNHSSNYYTATECKLIKLKNKNIYIQETYEFVGGDSIVMYIILSPNSKVEQDTFSTYAALDKTTKIGDISIEYAFVPDTNIGYCKFIYKDYPIYMQFHTQSEEHLINHLYIFILSQ